ncbi:MAG: DNA methylase [Ruminococcaceae bacterium]|nr:DNA methylase [Oscillospiraceae bacterium]
MEQKQYVCIDLKSFFASVECVERGLDPMNTNLVVADVGRTEKTICLAVTPPLKAYGIPGRARLFEVIEKLKMVNARRQQSAPGRCLVGSSSFDSELKGNPSLAVDFIAAPPRMAYYIKYSTMIYEIYLKYVAPEDIHVYSIDEVFINLTPYLKTYGITARRLTSLMIADVFRTTGITAAAGIGTNLYLAKIAMDIEAKHTEADENGVRIAELDELSYRRRLWNHRPLTDFWRIGGGYARRLETNGIYTMGDVARCSLGGEGDYYNEDLLYKLFGINAELLIDHAWGRESCTIEDIKAYIPESHSISSGQVLQSPYPFEKARLIVREMADALVLDLVDKGLVTGQMALAVGYDAECLKGERDYRGECTIDHYGRKIPKAAQGTVNLPSQISSTKLITSALMNLFDRIVDPNLTVRRLNITACGVVAESKAAPRNDSGEQLDLFTDYEAIERKRAEEAAALMKERNMQKAVLALKKKYSKNIILRGMNFEEGATARERNAQIGGHRA